MLTGGQLRSVTVIHVWYPELQCHCHFTTCGANNLWCQLPVPDFTLKYSANGNETRRADIAVVTAVPGTGAGSGPQRAVCTGSLDMIEVVNPLLVHIWYPHVLVGWWARVCVWHCCFKAGGGAMRASTHQHIEMIEFPQGGTAGGPMCEASTTPSCAFPPNLLLWWKNSSTFFSPLTTVLFVPMRALCLLLVAVAHLAATSVAQSIW